MKGIWFYIGLLFCAQSARAASLQGVVSRSDDGSTIANAQIVVHGTQFSATSNFEGHYLISNIPDGTYRLSCHHAQFLGAQRSSIGIIGESERNFSLGIPDTNHARVEGKTTCDSIPCAFVIIRALRYNSTRALAISGLEGGYVLSGLTEGEYQIHAMAYGYLASTAADVSVAPASDTDPQIFQRDINLTSAGGFTIRMRVGLSDNPLDKSGSTVSCNGQIPALYQTTDKGGNCTLDGVPAGPLSFTASRPGYNSSTRLDVMVPGDGEANFVLTKQPDPDDPRYYVAGTVQLDENAPETDPEDCRVSIWAQESEIRYTTYTNDEGRYSIYNIDPDDGPFQAGAAKEGFISQVVEPFSLDSNTSIDFNLSYDPNYDKGPGEHDPHPSCGSLYGQTQFGVDLFFPTFLVCFYLLRIRKWKSSKNLY